MKKLLIGLLIVIVLGAAAAGMGGNKPAGTVQPARNTNAKPTAPPIAQPVEAPSFTEITAAKKDMTDAQWDAYADTLKGKHITDWVGVVQNVDNKTFSKTDYVVTLDVQEPEGVIAAFDVKIDMKEEALNISKGQTMIVSGTIRQVSCAITYCPVELQDATYTVK